jgi:hypothetical protein
VTVNGALRWKSEALIMVSTALAGRYVGLEPVEDGIWIVYYRHVALGVPPSVNIDVAGGDATCDTVWRSGTVC